MRIIHCPQKLSLSGAEFYFLRISEELAKMNHEVKVLTSNALDFIGLRNRTDKINPNLQENINGVQIFRYPINYSFEGSVLEKILKPKTHHLMKSNKMYNLKKEDVHKFLLNGPFSRELFKNLMKSELDIIHAIAIPYASVLYSLITGTKKKVPKICTPFFHFENPRYHFDAYFRILKKYDYILTNSQAETDYLIKNGNIPSEKFRQIFMAVDIKKFQNAKERWFLDKYEKKGPMVLFCGHKNFEKGALPLLDSIPSVVKAVPDAQFVFIGPSTKGFIIKYKKLKKYRNNILNLGVLPYFSDLKRGAFMTSDVYAMPSRSEAFGICYLEAWACKKPVIGSNISAIQEIIKDEVDGVLTTFNDPKDLSEKLIDLLKNEDKRETMGKEGYNKIIKNDYSYEHLANKVENIYKEAIESK